jgi:hypothetical protein
MCAEVSGKHRQAPWGYAHSVISELHGLRSLVSAALDVPIPPRRPIKLSPFLLENDIMEVCFGPQSNLIRSILIDPCVLPSCLFAAY